MRGGHVRIIFKKKEKMRKKALITGGIGDIGLAVATKFLKMEMDLVLMDILSDEQAREKIRPFQEMGGDVTYIKCDVSSRRQVAEAIEKGASDVDICFCNAGVADFKPFLEITEESWNHVQNINLNGYFFVTQILAKIWVEQKKKGKFIYTGSWVQNVPSMKLTSYCVSKAAVWMLARSAALELAPYGITVNVVAPGVLDAGLSKGVTENPELRSEIEGIVPLSKLQSSEDVANVVAFLTEQDSDYLTGTTITCDGGLSIRGSMLGYD